MSITIGLRVSIIIAGMAAHSAAMLQMLAQLQTPGESTADRERREQDERFCSGILSRSFLHLGTEMRPVTRNIRNFVISRSSDCLEVTLSFLFFFNLHFCLSRCSDSFPNFTFSYVFGFFMCHSQVVFNSISHLISTA